MKKIIFSLVATAALSSVAFAGKNVAPVPTPPVPIPQKPAPAAPAALPPLGLYIGGGLTYARTSCKCPSLKTSRGTTSKYSSADTYGVNLKAGYSFNEYLAIEAKYLYTPWGDEDKTLKHYGIYLKPTASIDSNWDAYALLGYGKTKCETLNDTKKGFAWGLGAEYTLNKKKDGLKNGLGIYAEYLRPIKKNGSQKITTDTVSGGIAYHF